MNRLIPCSIALLMVLTACAGDDSNTPAGTTPASVPEPSTSVTTEAAPPERTTEPTTLPAGGGSSTTTTPPPPTTTTTTTEPVVLTTAPIVVSSDVPDYDMIDVHTGETVNLRSVVKGDKPLLFWFWSPL
ncbi:MAG: hypothetical protein F4135_01740 [Acidimicrobiia bacterium]|nr:hypothetical protein [Acidimicrobiia bacterium]